MHRPVATEAEIADAAAELARMRRQRGGAGDPQRGRHDACTSKAQAPVHVPAYPVKVRDVSGAGDTVAAVMAVLLAMKTPFESAMRAANAAAAVVVGKRGTATVSLAELRHRILPAASLAPEEKIVFDWSVLDERLAEWRQHGLRVGFTNGCFDLLHRGHIKLLAEARAACDRLVVGLNSDASTARLEGQGPADQSGRRPRRGARGARSRRSCRRVRGGYAARIDQAGAAGRSGQGRRLQASRTWSAATWSRARAATLFWSIWCPGTRPPAWCVARRSWLHRRSDRPSRRILRRK